MMNRQELKELANAYVVEHSRGAQAGTAHAAWTQYATVHNLIADARAEIVECIAAHHDREDRGEAYEREWEALMAQAKAADVGDVLAFDEHAWRIVEFRDEEE